MNFQPELARKVMAGEKTVTRRQMSDKPGSPWFREACTSKPGRSEAVTQGRGKGPAIGRIMVTDVSAVRLGDITHEEALAEGCESIEHFVATWSRINKGWNDDELVWRVEFRALTAKDEPFVLGRELTVAEVIVLARRAAADPGAFCKRMFRDPITGEADTEPVELWQARAFAVAFGPRTTEFDPLFWGTLSERTDGVCVEEASEVLSGVAG